MTATTAPQNLARHQDVAGQQDLTRQIEELGPWFHNLHLPDGTETAPDHWLGDFPAFKWAEIAPRLPADLAGWTALDVGCNAGFYTFELARRGARVTAVDVDPRSLAQARWAARRFGVEDRVTFREGQVYELGREAGDYDLVMFMGVFYHLRYPLLALDVLARKARRLLVFQTLTLPGDEAVEAPPDLPLDERHALAAPGWPKMAFLEHSVAGDPTNWWAPNHACVEALLRSSGLAVVERPGHEIYLCRPDAERAAVAAQRDRLELAAALGVRRRPGDA